ncbi:MAG TPA: hypothetical protein VHA77_11395 [Xanthobacteraceae bacterium]|jgi:hypothetical protein|nr:hypothetical protein [Xanthobacteraceae bacterium]
MAHGERDDRIRDLGHDLSQLSYTESELRKYLGPEMGALNVKQTEGIVLLIDMVRRIINALGSVNKDMSHFTVSDRTFQIEIGETKMVFDRGGEVVVKAGGGSIRLLKDGSIGITAKDIHISASGAIMIKGSSDVSVMSAKELQLSGVRTP